MKNKIFLTIIIILLPFTLNFLGKKDKNEEYKETPKTIFVNLNYKGEELSLALEDYLIGVVGAEVPASFHMEALKAQAIASRTFALYQLQYKNSLTTSDQAYNTKDQLQEKWQDKYDYYLNKIKNAILETKDIVMYYNNKLIKSYFYAMSNGYTTTALSVFNEELPYLNSVVSYYDNTSLNKFTVTKTMSKEEFCQKLNLSCKDIKITNINRDNSHRITSLSINNQNFSGITIRQKLELRSTDFAIDIKENQVEITTNGYGHGVGMSQYGANGMAKEGATYDKILKYYYQGIEIAKYNV